MSWLQYFTATSHRRKSCFWLLLESLPILFHVALVLSLSYFMIRHNGAGGMAVVIFLDLQIILNWIQFIRHRSIIRASSTSSYPGYAHKYPTLFAGPKAATATSLDAVCSTWKECDYCDLHVPIRSHHCPLCRRCIYLLDHHCYFLGACIGRTNQRFFLMFCLYASLGCFLGVINLCDVMSYYRTFLSWDFLYYLLPFTTVIYITGGNVATFELTYAALIDFGTAAFLVTVAMLVSGLNSVLHGSTPYEIRKNVRYEEVDDNRSVGDKLRQVFGDHGWLHLFTPFVPFPGPQPEPGYHRIIAYNNQYLTTQIQPSSPYY